VLSTGRSVAQAPAADSAAAQSAQSLNRWRFSLSVYGILPAEGQALVNPVLTADRGWLHLEARYNYEARQTGSAWVGYNFAIGHALAFEATPIAGAVFGNIAGVAVGLELALSYKKFELSSEQEFVYDARNTSESFFYAWPQLTYAPLPWLSFGIVAQRTRVYGSTYQVDPGVLIGLSYRMLQFSTYVFDVGLARPTWIFSLAVTF
jgi:hypothetical protein